MSGYLTTRALGPLLCLFLIVAGACGKDGGKEPSELSGAVISVDARSLTDIKSFMLRARQKTYEIFIDPNADYNSSGFPPQHLRDHVISGSPVTVEVQRRAGKLYAVRMEDA